MTDSSETPELKHILCVDDEADILEVAKMSLELVGGLKVSTCNSGREAVQSIAGIMPDIILLDVMMPGLDGLTTYSKLKHMDAVKHIPVIFMTAKVQPKEIAACLNLGSIAVIMKPFDPMKLASEVLAAWKNYHERK